MLLDGQGEGGGDGGGGEQWGAVFFRPGRGLKRESCVSCYVRTVSWRVKKRTLITGVLAFPNNKRGTKVKWN